MVTNPKEVGVSAASRSEKISNDFFKKILLLLKTLRGGNREGEHNIQCGWHMDRQLKKLKVI